MTRRRLVEWVVQGLLLALVAWFAARVLGRHWGELQQSGFALHPHVGWLLLSVAVVGATYALMIAAWRYIIIGWGEHLGPARALRIWALSNLGRYLPGKIWSVAGLVVLAQRAGVAGWAAVGSAVVLQAVSIGTGVAIAVGTLPHGDSTLAMVIAACVAAATIAAFATPPVVRLLNRVLPRDIALRPLALGAVAVSALLTALSWLGYALAFSCLSRGLVGAPIPFATAAGVFAAGYIIGLIAVFAPGGILVREGMFAALLTPLLGPGPALAVSVGSRILLTLTELGAAVAGLFVRGPDASNRSELERTTPHP